MAWKQALAFVAISVLGGLAGAAGLAWFLIAHPSLSWRLVPSTAILRIKQSVETVTAKRFVLVDDKGEALATLGVEGNGSFGLSIRSAESSFTDENLSHLKPAVRDQLRQFGRTHVVDDAVSIVVSKNGDVSETLGRVSAKHSYISLDIDQSTSRADVNTYSSSGTHASLSASGPWKIGKDEGSASASLYLAGKPGADQIFLDTDADGSSELSLIGERGTGRALLAVSRDDGPSLKLSDDAGTTRASFGSISLERIATGTTEKRGPSSIVLFGKDGKTIWEAP